MLAISKQNRAFIDYCKDSKFSLWNTPFVCWDSRTREIIIPNLLHHPNINRKIPEQFAQKLEENIKAKGSHSLTHLVARDQMISISIEFLVKNHYTFIKWVKDLSLHQEKEIGC